jgi:hypothetical protein
MSTPALPGAPATYQPTSVLPRKRSVSKPKKEKPNRRRAAKKAQKYVNLRHSEGWLDSDACISLAFVLLLALGTGTVAAVAHYY